MWRLKRLRGVPVIAYRRGGPAEIVQDGQTGFWWWSQNNWTSRNNRV